MIIEFYQIFESDVLIGGYILSMMMMNRISLTSRDISRELLMMD